MACQALLGLMILHPLSLNAQKWFAGRQEMGVCLGMSGYMGDLTHGTTTLDQLHPSAALYHRYNFSGYFSMRNQLSYLSISGDDTRQGKMLMDNGTSHYAYRNLNFQSNVVEYSSMVEFNFHSFGTNAGNEVFTPYAFTGLALFYFDPHRLDDPGINLRNLNTENRTRTYSHLQPAIPLGFGIKSITYSKKNRGAFIVGIEACWRHTYTDYLDDVNSAYPDYWEKQLNEGIGPAQYSHAQTLNGSDPFNAGTMRGDVHRKDWYYFYGLNLSYRFTPLTCR